MRLKMSAGLVLALTLTGVTAVANPSAARGAVRSTHAQSAGVTSTGVVFEPASA
jgi:hypothetical protein